MLAALAGSYNLNNNFLKKQLNNLIVLISIRIPVDWNADAIYF